VRLGPSRPLPRFALLALLTLSLLVAIPFAFPGARAACVRAFHAQANLLFRSFGNERAVRLSAPEPAQGASDTRMVGFDRGRIEPRFEARFSIFWRSTLPVAAVAALILATPLPWRRRLLALGIGVLVLHAHALALTALLAVSAFGSADATPANAVAWGRVSRVAQQLFNQELPRCIVVLLVWALLTQPGHAFAAAGAAPNASDAKRSSA
jgi:hypothetical protein